MESEAKFYFFALTHFLYANRFPLSGHADDILEHALFEIALGHSLRHAQQSAAPAMTDRVARHGIFDAVRNPRCLKRPEYLIQG